ncbi:hypothetical protein [Streptomyces phytohabitans]|uniref:hypothetical protein n=1 Tax=Streptomyces phytohabitans TaxID=1150371 RepID=UPI00345BEB3B
MNQGTGSNSGGQESDVWDSADVEGLDYLDYASRHLGLTEWLAVSRLFRPRFVEVEGCVIWERAYSPENFRTWCAELGGDATSVEATLNRLRLWQVVNVDDGDPDDERRLRQLADALASCWRSCLESDFPGRAFDCGVVETEDGPVVRFVVRRAAGGGTA